ncbi:MAG: hypothetical protein QNJ16_20670 [Rhodobacter sp.]|nr:hypothetical protein [Rhodobacter sp.]
MKAQTEQMSAQKLRLILSRALAKEQQGQQLTVLEEELIAKLHAQFYEKRRETIKVDGDGNFVINKTIDTEPMLEAVKAYGDFIDRYSQRKMAQRMVGSIDPITAYKWMRETGLKVGTREFAQMAMKRIKGDIDYRRFRVGG